MVRSARPTLAVVPLADLSLTLATTRGKTRLLLGLITQTLSRHRAFLGDSGIAEFVALSPSKKHGDRMPPDVSVYRPVVVVNDPTKYQIMATSPLAWGAPQASEAYDFIGQQWVLSVLSGVSSARNVRVRIGLIMRY